MSQPQDPRSKDSKRVLEPEAKYRMLCKYLQEWEGRLVQQVRLADPLKASNDSLLRTAQAQLSLIGEARNYIETLENGTEHIDPNRASDFLEPTGN